MSEAQIELTDELAQFLSDLEASVINGEITLSWMYDRLWTVRIGALGDYQCRRQFQIAWRSDELAPGQGNRAVPREQVRETVAAAPPGLPFASLCSSRYSSGLKMRRNASIDSFR